MISFGLPVDDIDRIYRALFAHSFGIYQMLEDATKRVKVIQNPNKQKKSSTFSAIEEAELEADSPTLKIK